MKAESDKERVEPTPLPQPDITQTEAETNRSFNPFSLFWGALLVELGILLLLQNYNFIDVDFGNVFRLWPLLIVAAGVSMLSLRGKIGTALISLLLISILALISLSAVGAINSQSSSRDTDSSKLSIARETSEIEQVRVSIKTGAGNLSVDAEQFTELVKATLNSSHSSIQQTSTTKNGVQTITLSTEGSPSWWKGEYKNDLSVLLNSEIPLILNLETGASSTEADLSKILLKELNVDSGASDNTITLGNKSSLVNVTLDIGMSSIKFRVPKDSGISLKIDSGMSNQDTSGLRDVGNGRYESENYATAANKINISGDMGMANLDIEYY